MSLKLQLSSFTKPHIIFLISILAQDCHSKLYLYTSYPSSTNLSLTLEDPAPMSTYPHRLLAVRPLCIPYYRPLYPSTLSILLASFTQVEVGTESCTCLHLHNLVTAWVNESLPKAQ